MALATRTAPAKPRGQRQTDELFSVQDKTVVITGGAGQLGRQFSLALADRGARVVVLDAALDPQRIASRFGQRQRDKRLAFLQVDITNRQALSSALQQVVKRWGVPHALVNNAGIDAPLSASAA